MEPNVSRETSEKLVQLANLVRRWNRKINLVSKATLAELEQRHIEDSTQLWRHRPSGARSWVDLGSGGGFPGLVIMVLAADQDSDLRVTLVESDARKSAFLRTAIRELGLHGRVRTDRIEALAPLAADVISARALAPLPRLLEFAERHMAPTGEALFMKGAKVDEEIAAALEDWRFDCDRLISKTDPKSSILKIRGLERVRPHTTPTP